LAFTFLTCSVKLPIFTSVLFLLCAPTRLSTTAPNISWMGVVEPVLPRFIWTLGKEVMLLVARILGTGAENTSCPGGGGGLAWKGTATASAAAQVTNGQMAVHIPDFQLTMLAAYAVSIAEAAVGNPGPRCWTCSPGWLCKPGASC
jgi:hypothetical protein